VTVAVECDMTARVVDVRRLDEAVCRPTRNQNPGRSTSELPVQDDRYGRRGLRDMVKIPRVSVCCVCSNAEDVVQV
jgi:hypothetical protein